MRREEPEPALLAGDEPPPVEVINARGRAPAVLVCDHASRFIPRALNRLGLDETELLRHIAWDIGAADVTRLLAPLLDAPAVLSNFSRLVIDPNRRPDHETSIPEESDGVEVPGNRNLSAGHRAARQETFFQPYQAAISEVLDERERSCGVRPVVISVHSFTPVMDGVERPWKLGILWNEDPRLPRPLIERLRAAGIPVGDNEPYSGREVFGYTTQVHADARGLANVLIEIRQDLIDTRHGASEWAGLLGRVLKEVLKNPDLYQQRQTS